MKWILPPPREGEGLLEFLLSALGIPDADLETFLNPSIDNIHDSLQLHDSTGAAKQIIQAISSKKKIGIHGDYDVDGVSATAILWDFLYRRMNADVIPYIPSRFDDGYGLSHSSIAALVDQGVELIITVDCGIKDADMILEYTKKGIQFIVTDHHTLDVDQAGQPRIPDVVVVHPRHPEGDYPFADICGTTVVWKLIHTIANLAHIKIQPDEYSDIVALATVCDLMPLVNENRSIVAAGIEKGRANPHPGIKALMETSGVDVKDLDTYHFGFLIGPRINAAGRIDSAMHALRLLSTTSIDSALGYAAKLNELNIQRQDITQSLIEEAESQVDESKDDNLIFVYGIDWPEGIVGLVSGKLSERYYRPVIAGSLRGGELVASARSPKGFHLADSLQNFSHLLERFGGHAQAAGLTVSEENLAEFILEITEYANQNISQTDLERELQIDLVLGSSDLTMETVNLINKLQPFGFGNRQPISALLSAEVLGYRIIGRQSKHIAADILVEGTSLKVIHFNGVVDWQGHTNGDLVDIAGYLDINEWKGNRSLQFRAIAIRNSQ